MEKNCQWRGDDGGVHCLVAGLSLHFCSSLCFWRVCGVSADVALETNKTAEARLQQPLLQLKVEAVAMAGRENLAAAATVKKLLSPCCQDNNVFTEVL